MQVRRRTRETLETEADLAEFDKRNNELHKAREQMALTLAKINYVNKDNRDRFLTLLMESRDDLAGLPFLKGNDCRMSKEVSGEFVNEAFNDDLFLNFPDTPDSEFTKGVKEDNWLPDEVVLARAAWMQTSPANAAKRKHIVKVLAGIRHPATTRSLGKLAVFAPEKSLREEAVAALKGRPRRDYTAVLLDGLRYPWAAAANNAADAMVTLKRADLVGHLVNFLDERDPRAPFDQKKDARSVTVVRELVRLNHHHNCITCHAPATSDPTFNATGRSPDFR